MSMNKCFKFLIGLFMITLFTGCSLNNAEKEDGGVVKVGLVTDLARNIG